MNWQIISPISRIQTIAIGRGIRELNRLKKAYGVGRWRKMKGIATLRLAGGKMIQAELHWYEAHGIGRKEYKIKKMLNHP